LNIVDHSFAIFKNVTYLTFETYSTFALRSSLTKYFIASKVNLVWYWDLVYVYYLIIVELIIILKYFYFIIMFDKVTLSLTSVFAKPTACKFTLVRRIKKVNKNIIICQYVI
jgi:hypothetical protein